MKAWADVRPVSYPLCFSLIIYKPLEIVLAFAYIFSSVLTSHVAFIRSTIRSADFVRETIIIRIKFLPDVNFLALDFGTIFSIDLLGKAK